MSVNIGKLVSEVKGNILFDELSGKRVAIDAFNTIYQFLSIIRQADGTPLMDSNGMVTSHLSGILYRVSNLLDHDINPVFVFDGMPPKLKQRTLEARMNRRKAAFENWQKAKEEGALEEARLHAMASTKIDKYVIDSSKKLLGLMGIPYIQAPGEGEAQAAYFVRKGMAYATASQDYDSFLFGSEVVIRNFTITGKRKLPKRNIYVDINLERIFLKKFLDHFGISREKLVWLGLLVGTDFNHGIEKIGPITALKLVKENNSVAEIENVLKEKYNKEFDVDPNEAAAVFLEPEVDEMSNNDFSEIISSSKPDRNGIINFMCSDHGFSEDRVGKVADSLVASKAKKGQRGIDRWM